MTMREKIAAALDRHTTAETIDAILDAMREPRPGGRVIAAGAFTALPQELRDNQGNLCPGSEGALAIWQAMIDAAKADA